MDKEMYILKETQVNKGQTAATSPRVEMNLTNKRNFVLALLGYVLLASANTFGQAAPYGLDTLIGKELHLRKSINGALVFYLNDSLGTYYYIDDDRSYIYSIRHDVIIKGVEIEGIRQQKTGHQVDNTMGTWAADGTQRDRVLSWIRFTIAGRLIGQRQIFCAAQGADSLNESQVALFLETAFAADPQNDDFPYFTINQESGLIHSTLCNHLCFLQNCRLQRQVYVQENGRLCGVCFPEIPAIPDAAEELNIGRQAENYYVSQNRFSTDLSGAAKLDSIGNLVLVNWPLELRGYTYRFRLVEDPGVNAIAFPGGSIFVTEGTLNCMDSDMELASLLAHEIAHVEFRHGLRQYRSRQNTAFWASLATATAATAVGAASDNNNTRTAAFEIARAIIETFAYIILNGYSQKYELEADGAAQLFVREFTGETTASYFASVLKKLQYNAREVPNRSSGSSLSTHPPLEERIERVDNRTIDVFRPPLVFRGLDKYGEVVACFSIVAVATEQFSSSLPGRYGTTEWVQKYRQVCYASMDSYVYLEKPSEVKHFKLYNVSGRFDNEADSKITPGQSAGMIFYREDVAPVQFSGRFTLELPLENVVKWSRRN